MPLSYRNHSWRSGRRRAGNRPLRPLESGKLASDIDYKVIGQVGPVVLFRPESLGREEGASLKTNSGKSTPLLLARFTRRGWPTLDLNSLARPTFSRRASRHKLRDVLPEARSPSRSSQLIPIAGCSRLSLKTSENCPGRPPSRQFPAVVENDPRIVVPGLGTTCGQSGKLPRRNRNHRSRSARITIGHR